MAKKTGGAKLADPRSLAPAASAPPGVDVHRADGEGGHIEGDGDLDEPVRDGDDLPVRGYGHPAGPTDRREVNLLVKRYMTAARAGDAVTACSLIAPKLRNGPGLAKAVPNGYLPVRGSDVLRGKDCVQLVSLMFGVYRQQIDEEAPTVRLTTLLVDGVHGLALLGFHALVERWIPVIHEGPRWTIGAILDSELI